MDDSCLNYNLAISNQAEQLFVDFSCDHDARVAEPMLTVVKMKEVLWYTQFIFPIFPS
jgi:hypothetical protein